MGSIEEQVYGTFTVPIYDGQPAPDPMERAHFVPPPPTSTMERAFPMVDFRSKVFNAPAGGDYTKDETFMASHGFTAVKHQSSITSSEGFSDTATIKNVYYGEVMDIVKQVTGCKEVVVTHSVCRGGPTPSGMEAFNRVGLGDGMKKEDLKIAFHKPGPAKPIRIPHDDSTARGGRQSVRFWLEDVSRAAEKIGIVEYEDAICAKAGVDACTFEGREIVEEKYNDHANGKLGPRYAAFSIWRPMKPATRDPLAMAPWSKVKQSKNHILWPYDNRIPGLDGKDFRKEFAMLKVHPEAVETIEGPEGLKWYYVSNQQPDEVLFVKLFDTAGLGEGAKEERGCLHGSPDLGEHAYGDTRESVEVRVMAFW